MQDENQICERAQHKLHPGRDLMFLENMKQNNKIPILAWKSEQNEAAKVSQNEEIMLNSN